MIWSGIFGTLTFVSLGLTLWQWLVARKFPLHRRSAGRRPGAINVAASTPGQRPAVQPGITLLKPLKGRDEFTEECLRSWLAQDYTGELQIIFAVDRADDPVAEIVGRLLAEFPPRDAQLVVCSERLGANAKVSKLATVEVLARHELIAVSDADMFVPVDFLAQAVAPLSDPQVGLVTSFYRLATPGTLAHRCEAVAINADFWSQVLQSRSLRPLAFALGAVMILRRTQLAGSGGFRALVNCLADDYQLGQRIARSGGRIELSSLVAECRESPQGWRAVWRHQLRWARTIRVCQPGPYFASVVSNATLWSLLCLATSRSPAVLMLAGVALIVRIAVATDLQRRLTRSGRTFAWAWLVPVKDLAQAALWLGAFLGDQVQWRGETYRVRKDGVLVTRPD